MTRYLLDTTVLIEFSGGAAAVTARVLALIRNKDEIGVSPVSTPLLAELTPPAP